MAKGNFTIIHGNVIYKVNDVEYDSSTTHRRFKRNGTLILSVPLNSVLVRNESDVTAKIVSGLNSPSQNLSVPVDQQGNAQSVSSSQDDTFLEGAIVGGIIGSIVF